MRIVPKAEFEKADAASYARQLAEKRERIEQLFKDMEIPAIEVHESKMEHHRMR